MKISKKLQEWLDLHGFEIEGHYLSDGEPVIKAVPSDLSSPEFLIIQGNRIISIHVQHPNGQMCRFVPEIFDVYSDPYLEPAKD